MAVVELYGKHLQSKKGGNDQESIQSSTTPDPGHRIVGRICEKIVHFMIKA